MKLTQGKWSKKFALVIAYFTCLIVVSLLVAMSQCRYRQPEYNQEFSSYPSKVIPLLSKNQFNPQNCDTIHLAIVCGGFNSTRNFYVLLKSILFYRTDNIQLHLFVDNISRIILTELFHTWQVQDLEVNLYNLTQHEPEVSWIMSQHYSHRYGLMKLAILSTLADSQQLTKVILIDTDMLVLGNIRRVWEEFDNLINSKAADKKPIFGLVENQSDWYLGDSRLSGGKNVWPAIGRGYNSGLILVDLIRLKRINWRQVWKQVAESELILHLSTSLADQDILNAVIRLHPYMLHELPCTFNIQLNDHTKLDEICPEKNEFKIIHWNSPNKFLTKNPKVHYYTNSYLNFRNWNGKLLEQGYCQQPDIKVEPASSSSSLDLVCREIQPRPEERLRTFLYFLDYEWEASKYDVTLVVHLSLDRMQVLDELALNWPGPISAAIYLSELETNLFLMSIENSENLGKQKNIGYHLVFKDIGFNYPINKLRNIALDNVLTDYVFLSDIDFLPSANLYDYLKQTISETRDGDERKPLRKRALVIAAFENLQYKFDFPASKAELLTQLNLGSVSMFRDQLWPRGHSPTNYAKWRASTKPYKVDWQPEYEPFIVTGREVARFDERFVGFGWNKVEHIMQLAALDYEFFVLPEAFVVHKLHSASYDIMKHRQSFTYRNCIKQVKRTFLIELRMKFPDFFARISAKPTNQTSYRFLKT